MKNGKMGLKELELLVYLKKIHQKKKYLNWQNVILIHKIGVSSDGKYDCYFSTNSGFEINFWMNLKKLKIQIIEKKERPKNGFVLSEKTDLENTEAFKK